MKKYQVLLVLLSLLFISSYCVKKSSLHNIVTFENESSDTLFLSFAFGYPDTLGYGRDANPISDPNSNRVLPNAKNTTALQLHGSYWETKFYDRSPSDKLMVFVFEASVLENTPWETVIDDYLVKERYDLTLQDLIDMNWTLTYPVLLPILWVILNLQDGFYNRFFQFSIEFW